MDNDNVKVKVAKEPKIHLIDGGALWSTVDFLLGNKFYKEVLPPSVQNPQEFVPQHNSTDTTEVTKSSSTTTIMSSSSVTNGASKSGHHGHGQKPLGRPRKKLNYPLHSSRPEISSPELFEEYMLGKSVKKQAASSAGPNLQNMEDHHVSMESGLGDGDNGDLQVEEKKKMSKRNFIDSEDQVQGQPKRARIKPRIQRPKSADTNEGPNNAKEIEIPDSLTGFFPKGYDPYKRRSDRLEFRALGAKEKSKFRSIYRREHPRRAAVYPKYPKPGKAAHHQVKANHTSARKKKLNVLSLLAQSFSSVTGINSVSVSKYVSKPGSSYPTQMEEEEDVQNTNKMNGHASASATETSKEDDMDGPLDLSGSNRNGMSNPRPHASNFGSTNDGAGPSTSSSGHQPASNLTDMTIDQLLDVLGLYKIGNEQLEYIVNHKQRTRRLAKKTHTQAKQVVATAN